MKRIISNQEFDRAHVMAILMAIRKIDMMDLAQESGISRRQIFDIRNRKSKPTTLKAVKNVLGFDLDDQRLVNVFRSISDGMYPDAIPTNVTVNGQTHESMFIPVS